MVSWLTNTCLRKHDLEYIPRSEIAKSYSSACSTLQQNAQVFFKVIIPIYPPTRNVKEFLWFYNLSHTCYCRALVLTNLVGVKWYLTGVCICSSLRNRVRIFLIIYPPSLWNACSWLLPIFLFVSQGGSRKVSAAVQSREPCY